MNKPRFLLLACAVLFSTLTTGHAQVRITEVTISTRTVELTNFGLTAVDMATWKFCHKFTYPTVGGTIAPGASRQFSVTFNQTASDLCLYKSSQFGSASDMEDFIQWGAGGNGRESVAVSKGVWTTGLFFPVPASGLSFHAKTQPPATGLRATNWFVGRPHAGFPVPAPVFESFAVTGGEWRIIANTFYLATALKTEANADLSATWLLQTPAVMDLGSGRFDIRFPTSGARQFVRIRAAP